MIEYQSLNSSKTETIDYTHYLKLRTKK